MLFVRFSMIDAADGMTVVRFGLSTVRAGAVLRPDGFVRVGHGVT